MESETADSLRGVSPAPQGITSTHTDWWMQAKFYELYIDKFAGTINGLTDHLDYFSRLGIDCLHLLPHYPSPMDDEGYDVSDFRGVRPELGTVEDLKRLFREARARNIRIIVDLVLNHVSVEHPWFREARASKTNARRDYFLWSETGIEFEGSDNPFSDFKKSNWTRNPETDDYYFTTFKQSQADLNWDNPEVLREMLEIIDYLVELGASGFRLDAVPHLIKREGTRSKHLPETHAIIRKIRGHLNLHHPDVILLGEVSGQMHITKPYFGDGDECHLVYNFHLAAEMLYALLDGDQTYLGDVLNSARAIPAHTAWAAYLSNHDEMNLGAIEPERRQRLIDLLDPAHHFPFKKGQGTARRLMSAFGNDERLMKKAMRLLYSVPFATVMYYGDEIGMENLPLPPGTEDNRLSVRGQFNWGEAERQMADPKSLWNAIAATVHGAHTSPVSSPWQEIIAEGQSNQ
jgi:maltose alpha-D-glucosyltransferase / alpha-amylase